MFTMFDLVELFNEFGQVTLGWLTKPPTHMIDEWLNELVPQPRAFFHVSLFYHVSNGRGCEKKNVLITLLSFSKLTSELSIHAGHI